LRFFFSFLRRLEFSWQNPYKDLAAPAPAASASTSNLFLCVCLTKSEPFLNGTDGALSAAAEFRASKAGAPPIFIN